MSIDVDLLMSQGAISKKYKKNEIIFYEGNMAKYYYQVVSGKVKMYSLSSDTKELTQGVFREGESFAEPPLFINEPYPASAVAQVDSVVIFLLKDSFHKLLDECPELQKFFLKLMAERAYAKSILAKELIDSSPEKRILAFLDLYKKGRGASAGRIQIEYTRQEIANSTGLCVETVIRTLSKMSKEDKVAIIEKKLFY